MFALNVTLPSLEVCREMIEKDKERQAYEQGRSRTVSARGHQCVFVYMCPQQTVLHKQTQLSYEKNFCAVIYL